jgi:hypothetical protein
MKSNHTLWVAGAFAFAFGLITQVFTGFQPFPFGDDFAYAPLAEHRANPLLFARDVQLGTFASHALVYEWVYGLGKATLGVGPVFQAALTVLAVFSALALFIILRTLGAPAAALPLVLAIGVVVTEDGLGRGDFGGLISDFFHHHNVALTLVLGAVACALHRRIVVAGLCLGAAAYAQPMTAWHGAMIVGAGVLVVQPRVVIRLALIAALVATPAAWLVFGQMGAEPGGVGGIDVIEDAYRFRAPAHYDPEWASIGLTTLYLLAGWAGAGLLLRPKPSHARFAIAGMAVFTALHLVSVGVYKLGLWEWLPFFILDANRSTPLLFVLGAGFAIAGCFQSGARPASFATGLLLTAILALNGTIASVIFLVVAACLWALGRVRWGLPVGAVALLAAALWLFPPTPFKSLLPDPTRQMFDRIRAETPPDALFVIPVSMMDFRHYTQRSVYVDFKLFSVAQSGQAALTRERIDQIVTPASEHADKTGWAGVRLWDEDQRKRADCEVMSGILASTGAEYYLRPRGPQETVPLCSGLPTAIETATLVLYGPVP